MIWKILIFVAVIAGVLAFFRYMNRPPGGGARKKAAREADPGQADGQSVDLVKCGSCGAFIAPQTVCGHCGQ